MDYVGFARKAFIVEPLCKRCGFVLTAVPDGTHREHTEEECLLNEVMLS
jgi:hypothetical protein